MKRIFLFILLLPTVAMAQLELPFSVRVINPRPTDAYYYNAAGTPYTNTAQVISQVASSVRYRGQTFNVSGVEWWFGAGTANGDLVVKTTSVTDGDKGDIIVSSSGATWMIDPTIVEVWTGKHTFTGDGTNAGFNFGSFAIQPVNAPNGDAALNSTTGGINFRVGGVWITAAGFNATPSTSFLIPYGVSTSVDASRGVLQTNPNFSYNGTTLLVGGSTPTASTSVDIRGVSSGNILRLANNSNTTVLSVSNAGITQDDAQTRILAVDGTTGQLFWRAASSFGGGGSIPDGDKGDITVSSSGTVWAIDANINKAWTGTHSFLDNNFSILDQGDNTKVAQFELSGINTGTTRTLTVPNASGTLTLGTGTANRVAYWNGTNSLTSSADYLFDGVTSTISGAVTTTSTPHLTLSKSLTASSGTAVLTGLNVTPTFNTTGTYAGSSVGFNYAATRTSVTGLTEYVIKSDGGQILFGNAGADVVTASTRFDIRGISGGNITSLRSHDNNPRFTVSNAGLITHMHATMTTTTTAYSIGGGFSPSSGTGVYTGFLINPTFNTTGTYAGTIRGFYFNPTNTSLTGATLIAWENTSGQIRLGGVTQDNTKTQVIVRDGGNNQLFWRDASTFTGITNTAPNNELMKSDGTNAVSSGLLLNAGGMSFLVEEGAGSNSTLNEYTFSGPGSIARAHECVPVNTGTNNSVWYVEATAVAMAEGGTTGGVVKIAGLFRRDGSGNITQIGTTQTLLASVNNLSGGLSVTFDITGGANLRATTSTPSTTCNTVVNFKVVMVDNS